MNKALTDGPTQPGVKPKALLYVDPISPYAYFYLKQLDRLDTYIDVKIIPILFGAVLAH